MRFDYEKYIPEVIVSLSFINTSNPSEFTKAKQYKYLINHNTAEKLIKDIDIWQSIWGHHPLFKIENESGYNYRGSKVIIHRIDFFTDVNEFRKFCSSSPNLVKLKKIIVVDEKSPIKCDYFVNNLNERQLKIIDSLYQKDTLSSTTKISENFSALTNTCLETAQSLKNLSTTLNDKFTYATNSNSLAIGSSFTCSNSLDINLEKCNPVTIKFKNGDSIMTITPDSLNITCENNNNNNNIERGNNMFNNVMKDFYCGPATDVKMSIYGPAFRAVSAGGDRIKETYVAYHNSEYIDVLDGILDIGTCAYVMPIAAKSVKKGDFIKNCGTWLRVTSITNEVIEGENVYTRNIVKVRPTKNMFGFNFYSKLITFDIMGSTSEDNPFGNLLPLILLGNKDSKINDMLPLMFMNKDFDMSNPMMMYLLANKNGSNNDLMTIMMMNQFMNKEKKEEKKEEKE